MKKSLKKRAIIFGGSSGIGLATTKLLGKKGVDLIIVSKNLHKLKTIKREIEKTGATIHVFAGDTSNLITMKSISKKIKNQFKKIDYLVNTVGISIPQKQGILNMEIFTKLIEVNLKSVYLISMLYGYEIMNQGGSIVNVASIRGRTGTDSFSAGYAAAKAGVINLTKTFAKELAVKNVRVNCVAPGATYPTGMSKSWPKSLRDSIAQNIPLKRLGTPKEMAKVIVFLLSKNSSYVTGQTIDVNGGQWMN